MAFDDSQLNDLIAPYQRVASQVSSPYATIGRNSWLANKHPLVAQALDNAFLTAAMTPGPRGPEGAGEGISRTFQGLLGAQQYRHQKMLEDMMLPFQMAMPRLQAEHTLAQIQQSGAYSDYLRQHGEYLSDMADVNQQKADIAQQRADQAKYGKQMNDPEERFAYNSVFKKYGVDSVDKLSLEQLQEAQGIYQNAKRQTRMHTGSLTQGDIIAMQMSDDPDIKAKGEQAAKIWSSMYGMAAGARTGGSESAPHPYSEQKSFLQSERQRVYGKISPTLSYKDWSAQFGDKLLGEIPGDTPQGAMTGPTPNQQKYQEYLDKAKLERQKTDFNWAQYERWAAQNPGKGYEESPWGSHPPSSKEATSPAQPSNSGSSWTPRQ